MTPAELKEVVQAVQQASAEAAVRAERNGDKHCNVRWRRRVIIMASVFGALYLIKLLTHHEVATDALHLGVEGAVAVTIDKLTFGVA
ncbi:hypothetical protein KZJ38_07375 [Paraburkholderia edwinii]|uniref:Uncharacterized protein n=1 Tax=Paraburkholderia edwinii TaxID=2861782 RepID=A0ABX8UN44_9BURK|nr:hypothetical protein [Paraburkholderia edwinii]QYD70121.1 hypothetical protein KZJ38_07375 [Paraburkholderia edwinii]